MTPSSEQPADALPYPSFDLDFLSPYLPTSSRAHSVPYPHVTLTYASSLDAKISVAPGIQTVLSGRESKLMTHHLRSRHDAILVGVGTAVADDPGLNCRLFGAGGYGAVETDAWQPRPIIVDPSARWSVSPDCRVLRTVREGKGKAPWVVVASDVQPRKEELALLKEQGGDYLAVDRMANGRLSWEAIFSALPARGIGSVMVEGGGSVLRELLNHAHNHLLDSVIVTMAPTFLGSQGVSLSPQPRRNQEGKFENVLSLKNVRWQPLGQDVVLCGGLNAESERHMPRLQESE